MARGKSVGPLMALATQLGSLSEEDRAFVQRVSDELNPVTRRRRRRKSKDEDAEAEPEPKTAKASTTKKTKKTKKGKKAKKLLAGTSSDE